MATYEESLAIHAAQVAECLTRPMLNGKGPKAIYSKAMAAIRRGKATDEEIASDLCQPVEKVEALRRGVVPPGGIRGIDLQAGERLP